MTNRWTRIKALVRQDVYLTRRDMAVWSDLFFLTFMNILVFGLIARHFADGDPQAARFVLSGMVLWEIVRLSQYCFSLTTMMNVWSNNLSNLFIAPISRAEFVAANSIIAVIKGLIITTLGATVTWLCFDFNILSVGIGPLALAVIALIMSGIALGLFLLGIVFQFGIRVQALTWSAVVLLQPLIGVYVPLDVLPTAVQWISHVVPATHAFIGIRHALTGEGDVYGPLVFAVAYGAVVLAAAYRLFGRFHRRSMTTGQFARNDS
jgi:ABC-type multidrug transport system permease subunit